MTGRAASLLAISLTALALGLSLGGRMFYLTALFGMLALSYALLSVLLSRVYLRVRCELTHPRLARGENTQLIITVGRCAPLPVYPLELSIVSGADRFSIAASPSPLKAQTLSLDIAARHVGLHTVGVEEYVFYDIFGLFRARIRCGDSARRQLMVLPQPFEVDPLRFLSGDEGTSRQNRTTEDLSSPEDVRTYRAGDPLKRIHWKLSSRRRELIVRRFETPAPPDTLILLDFTLPGAEDDSEETRLTLRDALCETALSVADMQSRHGHPVRVPLYSGQTAHEFHTDNPENIPQLKELLACQPFTGGGEFERVLHTELRRMRATGATVIITTHLNAGVVEGVKHIRKMGPNARMYLITRTPDAPQDKPYVAQLQQCLVEVCYVSPA